VKPRIENIPDMIYHEKNSGLLAVHTMYLRFSAEFYKHQRGWLFSSPIRKMCLLAREIIKP